MTLLLVVALPLASAATLALVGERIGRRGAGAILLAGLALSFGAAVAIAQAFSAGKTSLVAEIGPWLPLRGADLSLRIEPPMVPVVVGLTAVAALIGLAAIGSRQSGADAARFGAAFGLATSALLLVVVAQDLLLLFAGWELLAASTYLLVAHRRDRPGAAAAGVRSFVVARVGDTALLVAILSLLATFRTVDIGEIAQRVSGFSGQADAVAQLRAVLLAPSLLVLIAALARSAQLPFQIWMLDVPRAPSAASALIESSVAAAGVLLLVRLGPILHPDVLIAGAAVGAVTAAVGAIAALAQTDRRTLVAWSTVSQVGLMFVGLGSGAASAAIFQVLAHAFAKSTTLLAEWVRDTRLGSLVFTAGALSLAAIGPVAGMASVAALSSGALERWGIFVAVAIAILLTGVYAARLMVVAVSAGEESTHPGRLVIPAASLLAAVALSLGAAVAFAAPAFAVLAFAGLGISVALPSRMRAPVPVWLRLAARSGLDFDRLYRASLVAAFEAAARALDLGTERVVAWAGDEIGLGVVRAGGWLDGAHRRYARASEAIVVVAAIALVAYWSLR